MSRLRRAAAFALGSVLLPACVAPPVKPQTTAQMTIKPVWEIRHAADGSAAAQYELGKDHQARGNLDLALDAYVQALTLDSRNVEALNAIATIYSQQGRLAEAESTLREAVAQNPAAAYLHNNLGYTYYLRGNHDAAINELLTAISLDPRHEWARNNLEMVQAAVAKRFDSLVAHAGTSPAQTPTTVAAFEIWGDAEGSRATVEATASAAVRTIPEIVNPMLPDDRAKAEDFTRIEIAKASRMPTAEILPNVDPVAPNALVQLGQLERRADFPMRTSVATAEGAFRLEISNGNGVTGMAKRVSQVLGGQGIPVHRLTNQQPYRQMMTAIQYRDGFEREAENLKERLSGYAVVARVETPRPRIDIRVVLGKDIKTHMAEIETEKPAHVAISKSGTEQVE
jgi:tetratricopeptide (TPR) repeat protein